MDEPTLESKVVVELSDFPRLFDVLKRQGYQVFGPRVHEGAIVYDELASMSDLPIGWTDEQSAGTYRLRRRDDQALFGYVVGPHSWKKFLHPPVARLWQASRTADGFQIVAAKEAPPKFAFIGVRSCELHAIAIQDKVFVGGPFTDPVYQARREQICVIAVNCGQAGGTCFCVSMNTGPKATSGFDFALTEILEGGRHYFTVEAGTDTGWEILRELPHAQASDDETQKAEKIVAQAAAQMGRSLQTDAIKELLYANLDHPRWDEVAARCLSCGNCTMVCPTCFCSTVEDASDLQGEQAERWRKWESCFSVDFSYVHGGAVRPSTRSRYRQWLTHKLASWIDQFGSSGCVGCGRCITWCPVGIDITEEVAAIRGQAKEEREP